MKRVKLGAVSRSAFALFALSCLSFGCASELKGKVPTRDGGEPGDAGDASSPFGNGHADGSFIIDASISDAAPSLDAFFVNDPPPLMCAADGGMTAAPSPGGTPDCPNDKNREGCVCPMIGQTAACWPGKRVNRNHGVCKDGMTTCVDTSEFGPVWGACKGYVLPTEGALAGPDACSCFSAGKWDVDDLVPCAFADSAGTHYWYSSHLDADGKIVCDAVPSSSPPPVPVEDWNHSTINIDCGGHFTLCYTIKAGDVDHPNAADCVLVQQCLDVVYATPGQTQTLPALPGWSNTDALCSAKFAQGGYGEMTVQGISAECQSIDDGMGKPEVIRRSGYCPAGQMCSTGGSGNF